VRKKPSYVSCYRDRHGKLRWRFRRAGFPQAQTTEVFGSEGWWRWYASASSAQPVDYALQRIEPGSINALAVAYYASADFKQLRASTQRTYRGILDRYRDKYGSGPAGRLEPKYIRKQMDVMGSTPAAANNMLKVLRAVMKFGCNRGLLKSDPTNGVAMLRYRTEGFHSWTELEIAAFELRWPVGTRERLAFDLLLYTAQRSGDVRIMTLQQVREGRIYVRQEKTGQPVDIPMHANLRTSINTYACEHMVLLSNNHGIPYSEKGFGNWIKKAAISAGLPHCSAHGLRKAAARRLAEAGCSAHEIMAITGHQTLSEAERYTREAGRKGLADAAMSRIA
jgi:integrase